jgi:hypothetical protein
MGKILLYSTNVFLKLLIQADYMNDVHYVWCSEEFDSNRVSAYSRSFLSPPSSNPADIFRQLKRDIDKKDAHSSKINEQKVGLTNRALEWEKSGLITATDKDDIVFMVNSAPLEHFRPLIYVIPRPPVETRLKKVPMNLRAGIADEYTIDDLKRTEFDIVEL